MQQHHKMRRLSYAGLSDGGSRPLYFTSAAEPLIIETPIERKISRAKIEQQQQMAAIADINSGTVSTQKSSILNNGSEKDSQPTDWSSRMDDKEQKGILKSLRSYPKGVFFMLGNEFCERFSFYGMRAILIIYLMTDHHLDESTAKERYHIFVSLAYLSPLLGSILADNYFGRFRVILWVSLLYVFGHILLSIGAIPLLEETIKRVLDYSGLFVIALATGGIKPCVSAFAADQFSDEQSRQRTQFFSFFYFAINAGSLIAIAITPLLRQVRCLNSDHCFPLAFGVPGVLMLIAFVTFLFGWPFYKITPASKGNILWKVVKCIFYALRLKLFSKISKKPQNSNQTPIHWLDYAVPKYDWHLVAGIKSMLSVLVLYMPVILFWALFDQQGSTWVLQARRMDGRVGWFTILPDQMSTFNALMILILVPLFEAFIYPFMSRICNITPLRKMAVGGIWAGIAFCIAGCVQMQINGTMEARPAPGKAYVYLIGNYSFTNITGIPTETEFGKNQIGVKNYTFNVDTNFTLDMATDPPTNYVVGLYDINKKLQVAKFPYKLEKTEEGKTRFYFLVLDTSSLIGTEAVLLDNKEQEVTRAKISNGKYIDIQPGFFSHSSKYTIIYGDCIYKGKQGCNEKVEVEAQMGAASFLDLISPNPSMTELVRSNSVNILWQLPQLFVITVGEILFAVTGLEFSYSQAAPSMKSVLQALWLLTVFFGNVVDIIIAHMQIADPVAEFFVYAAMMFAVMGIFIVLAMRYQYVDEHNLIIPDSDSPPNTFNQEDEEMESKVVNNLPRPHILEKKE